MPEASRVSTPVSQASHGFSRGDAVRFDGDNWALAVTGQPGVGLVGSTYDANSFEFVQFGELDALDGLVPGATYYPAASGISTTVNGTAIGIAYTDRTIFVGQTASAASSVDTSGFATQTQIAAINAAIAALAASIVPVDGTQFLHSIQNDAVISVDPGNVGVVFDETDGTQVLVE